MVSKKDLMIVALATFCLAATMFIVISTNITNASKVPEPTYKIVKYSAVNFSWGGGVTQTKPWVNGTSGGYSRLTVQILVYSWSPGQESGGYATNISAYGVGWYSTLAAERWGAKPHLFEETANVTVFSDAPQALNNEYDVSGPIEVCSPYYEIIFRPSQYQAYPFPSTGWVLMNVTVYLRNE
jgi:hypothetical protein